MARPVFVSVRSIIFVQEEEKYFCMLDELIHMKWE